MIRSIKHSTIIVNDNPPRSEPANITWLFGHAVLGERCVSAALPEGTIRVTVFRTPVVVSPRGLYVHGDVVERSIDAQFLAGGERPSNVLDGFFGGPRDPCGRGFRGDRSGGKGRGYACPLCLVPIPIRRRVG